MDKRLPVARLGLLLLLPLLWALAPFARAAEADFLDPEVAFKLVIRPAGDRSVAVDFTIAPGYYLYRDQLRFSADGATLGSPALPPGQTKFDETFQKNVDIYRDTLRIQLPVERAGARFLLVVSNQGCADKGLCYPPQRRGADVGLAGFGGSGIVTAVSSERLDAGGSTAPVPVADASIDRALQSGHIATVMGVCFLAGLLLSLTPCVLPMLPILSSVIVGAGASVTRGRGLSLAATYSLGMALVYTVLGIAAGLAGEGMSAALQRPLVLATFAAALMALGLSMLGAFELQLPTSLTSRLATASQRLTPGRYLGVFAMGGVSALLVSPCIVAPLAGALLYIGQTHDVWLGGAALFALAAGMSVPLLLLGASAGALLPRAGPWMDDVKRLFGWVLMGVALYTVQSLLSPTLVLAGWACIAFGSAITLAWAGRATAFRSFGRGGRALLVGVLALAGLLQMAGAVTGASSPLEPWAVLLAGKTGPAGSLPFKPIRSVDELDAAVRTAGRPVMLDFYADWCVSCKEMERYTFVDPEVRRKAGAALLLRADVTANNEDDRAMLKRFHLFGPPGTLFFDAQGREVAAARVVGFQDVKAFSRTLAQAGLQ